MSNFERHFFSLHEARAVSLKIADSLGSKNAQEILDF